MLISYVLSIGFLAIVLEANQPCNSEIIFV